MEANANGLLVVIYVLIQPLTSRAGREKELPLADSALAPGRGKKRQLGSNGRCRKVSWYFTSNHIERTAVCSAQRVREWTVIAGVPW